MIPTKGMELPRSSWGCASILARAIALAEAAAASTSPIAADQLSRVAEEVALAASALGVRSARPLHQAADAMLRSEARLPGAVDIFNNAVMVAREADELRAEGLAAAAHNLADASRRYFLAATRWNPAEEEGHARRRREIGDDLHGRFLDRAQAQAQARRNGDTGGGEYRRRRALAGGGEYSRALAGNDPEDPSLPGPSTAVRPRSLSHKRRESCTIMLCSAHLLYSRIYQMHYQRRHRHLIQMSFIGVLLHGGR